MGPMFAGKSTELLRRVREAQSAGKSTSLIKPTLDKRYELASVTTHDGDKLSCHTVETLLPLLLLPGEMDLSGSSESFKAARSSVANAQVIAIDEAQFFPDLAAFAIRAVEAHGKELLIAGLDGDFKRRKFGSMIDLIPIADSVKKVKGKCHLCSKESLFSFRTAKDSKQELIGGEEAYVPLCREHYVNLTRASSKR